MPFCTKFNTEFLFGMLFLPWLAQNNDNRYTCLYSVLNGGRVHAVFSQFNGFHDFYQFLLFNFVHFCKLQKKNRMQSLLWWTNHVVFVSNWIYKVILKLSCIKQTTFALNHTIFRLHLLHFGRDIAYFKYIKCTILFNPWPTYYRDPI